MLSTLADDSIILHYQPLARCSGGVVGLEALMRWHHQKRGPISPEAFIPVSERSGLIAPLSRWALGVACRQAARWRAPLFVAVNISAKQFAEDDDLPALVDAVLAESGLPPERLELELTEAALESDPGRAAAAMRRLRERGVKLALDDFGIGASSLSSVRDFPFTRIKIDGSVVGGIETSASARSIVRMLIELAHALDRSVTAEGVETTAQLVFLEAAGCDLAQGYLLGRARAIEDLAALTNGQGDEDDAPALAWPSGAVLQAQEGGR